MPSRTTVFLPLLALAIAAGAIPEAQAQSRRGQADIEALQQRMTEAEARYREAMVKAGNNDPAGVDESNAALEDMEDVIVECGRTRGCGTGTLLATYKRLLKAQVDAAAAAEDDEADTTLVDDGDGLPTGDVPPAATAAALLSADDRRFMELVQMNPAVQAGIRRWLTDMRVSLITSHENYQYMQHLMSPGFTRRGLPEALLFGILAKESNGRVHSRSRAGALGPLQFMPATGARFGLGRDDTGFDTRYDARMSADAAAAYLSERFAELGNNIEYWLAAYNGGEGRARRVYREFNGRPFWDVDVYNQFPAETKDYVPMVIAAAWLYMHPREYGLVFPRVDTRPATFALKQPASIYELTICLGNGGTREGYMRALRNLNPRYEAEQWIPAGTVLNGTVRMAGLYERWCVRGARAELARRLVNSDPASAIVRTSALQPVSNDEVPAIGATPAAAPAPAPAAAMRTHRVARGETLVAIAQRYQCDTGVLARANGIAAPRYLVRQGQSLKLEGCRR
ncbi:LysM peptidoglycan-binding domain-containing protein [Luteimonas aestuarii]|uniref:LysM peptidoglycan-binding domain-containing protein n=1 Tax=Luteimonas aestuarii TaxID=453837 RepID=A0A4R5U428_9GAMM|nr:transglycosylase SLT domain-containing protein [Luteimonas aestuarii]TDK28458.1 LysM peptidoglycan-binding domain-containing protein [Luteimonas aestuarii]